MERDQDIHFMQLAIEEAKKQRQYKKYRLGQL